MTAQIGPRVHRDEYVFPFDTRQQTVALAHFISGLPDLRATSLAQGLKRGGIDDLADDLEMLLGDITWEQLDEPAEETLLVKIVRNWLEDVEWRSLSRFIRHIAYREPLRWKRRGPREFDAAAGLVHVNYCMNATGTPWRLTDDRGAWASQPKPAAETLSLHPTLGEAVKRARRATWHLDHDT
ncbi:hypothetical protein [Nonomuraea jabiensis]|uniref:hypothetical protein n=1 Tax=Nonomuraea jabiensis TaxID=882448 RepID=UPI003D71B7B3